MKQERIFEIGGEGGSITIYREKRKTGNVFIYNHNETDFSKEGLDISKRNEFLLFEDALKLITTNYPIHALYIDAAHPDFKQEIINGIVNHLNEFKGKLVNVSDFYSKEQFEKLLGVSFTLTKKEIFSNDYIIDVKALTKLTEYDYSKNEETSILKATYEIYAKDVPFDPKYMETIQSDYNFQTVGSVEVVHNSIIIKNLKGTISHILPSDKYVLELTALADDITTKWAVKK